MTYREKLAHEHPDHIDEGCPGGVNGCPHMFGYENPSPCYELTDGGCRKCWDREIPDPTDPHHYPRRGYQSSPHHFLSRKHSQSRRDAG